jgi:mRNA-capping enzyme
MKRARPDDEGGGGDGGGDGDGGAATTATAAPPGQPAAGEEPAAPHPPPPVSTAPLPPMPANPPLPAIAGLELPTGWLQCPKMGRSFKDLGPAFNIIPCKTPLGPKFDRVVPEANRFSPAAIADLLASQGRPLGLVIDLTNTGRYYDPAAWGALGIMHQKVLCPPRGRVPSAPSMNHFTYLLVRFFLECPGKHVLVHCTHGFNRTGFMIATWLIRRGGLTVAAALRRFAEARPPGIYKPDYIAELFRYYHEARPASAVPPPLPAFKVGEPDSPRRDGDENAPEGGGEAGEEEEDPDDPFARTPVGAQVGPDVEHDTPFGEPIPPEEELEVRQEVMSLARGGRPVGPYERLVFPGSQPVSLDATNLKTLAARPYLVTWKADGTRYLVFIMPHSTYLLDRAFNVRRVQMRWPTPARRPPAPPPGGPPPPPPPLVGPPHVCTLLDGELVVDEDLTTGERTRRFLAYDCLAVNGKPLVGLPFKDRYRAIEEAVVAPRSRERDAFLARRPGAVYDYGGELMRVRRKEFWPLGSARSLLSKFIPRLSHESDGLILQPSDDPYETGTCADLLKWKYAHMNSVDFKLRVDPSGDVSLLLLETRDLGAGAAGAAHKKGLVPLPGGEVELGGRDPADLANKIVECAWNGETGKWVFMRVRPDKDAPNAYHVYEKVVKSIQDNITEEVLLAALETAGGSGGRGSGGGGGGGARPAAPAPPPPPKKDDEKDAA